MKRVDAILAAAMALTLAGCVLRGKQPAAKAVPAIPVPVAEAAPPPPPSKLSIPQTNVELPPPQPVNLDALTQTPPREEPPAAAPSAVRQPRRTAAAPAPASKPEAPAPVPVAPAVAPAAESDRPPLQEIVPPEDQKRFQEVFAADTKEMQQRLDQIQARRLNGSEKTLVDRIQSFKKQSEAAAERGDWRGASELAERALALAKDLTGGK